MNCRPLDSDCCNWFNWNMTVIVKQVYVHRRTIRCLSHSSIMCHIISLYTPWPVRICARSEYLDLLYFFDGMSLPVYSTQTWPRLVSCWLWSYALAVILTNPHHLHSRTPPPLPKGIKLLGHGFNEMFLPVKSLQFLCNETSLCLLSQ